MSNFLAVAFCILSACCGVCSINVSGYKGEGVSIRCNYSPGYEDNKKYFCRGLTCKDLIKTGEHNTWVTDGRFSLYDNTAARVFIVKITGLEQEDAGKYWCAVDISGYFDIYTVVQLEVKEREEPPAYSTTMITTVSIITATTHLSSDRLFITAGLSVTVLAFGVLLFIFHRQRNKKLQGNANVLITHTVNTEEEDFIYEKMFRQPAASTVVTFQKDIGNHTPGNPQRDNVYQSLLSNTVQRDSMIQKDVPRGHQID